MSDSPAPGKTTVAPTVLLSVARLTTLQVKGVAGLSPHPAGLNTLLQRNAHMVDGVRVKLTNGHVHIDLYVILKDGVNFRQVSQEIQKQVARAITEMVGLEAKQINVHIEDISFTE